MMSKKVAAIVALAMLASLLVAGCTNITSSPTPKPTAHDSSTLTSSASSPPYTWSWRGMLTDLDRYFAPYVELRSWSDRPENDSVQHMNYVIYDARNGATITADLKVDFTTTADATKYVDNNSAGYSPYTGDRYFASNHTELAGVYYVGGHGYYPKIIRTFERVESQSLTEIKASIIDQTDEYVVYGTFSVSKQ